MGMGWSWIKYLNLFLNKILKAKLNSKLTNFFCLVVFPICLLYVAIKQTSTGNSLPKTNDEFRTFDQEYLKAQFPQSHLQKLIYTPECNFTESIVNKIQEKLEIVYERIQPYKNRSLLDEYLSSSNGKFFAIDFQNACDQRDSKTIPSSLNYTIISKSNFETNEQYSNNFFTSYYKDSNKYIDNGFAALQFLIDTIYIEEFKTGFTIDDIQLTVQHMPLPEVHVNETSRIGVLMLLIGVYILIPLTYLLLLPLINESQSGFKEYLKNVTIYHHLNNVCAFLFHYIFIGVIYIILCLIIWMSGVFKYVGVMCPIVLVLLFLFSIVCFTFFLSSLFRRELFASFTSPILYVLPYIISNVVNSTNLKSFLNIFPINAYASGVEIFDDFANSGHYFSFSDLTTKSFPVRGSWCILAIYGVLIISGLFYLLLYYYIDNVWPGSYGTAKHKLFIFNIIASRFKSMFKSNAQVNCLNNDVELEALPIKVNNSTHTINCDVENNAFVVQLKNLCKSYGGKVVVDNVNLNIYRNQITVLLGHNGAGKTTTLNMLTGMIPKEAGEIIVEGERDADSYRKKIGFCPQHNILLPYLTCFDHLMFFGQLRGLSHIDAKNKSNEILNKLCMGDKKIAGVQDLSGGMMRKLCMANAMIGNTKLLILDEPTSGLDPEARLDLWNILLKLKSDQSILLTTHIMEEAEILGDQIAIMNNAKVIEFGPSNKLKEKYKIGYTFKILKKDSTTFDARKIKNIFEKNGIIDAQETPSIDSMYCITVPYTHLKEYSNVLEEMEANMEELGIDVLTISNGTLDDVFLRCNTDNNHIPIKNNAIIYEGKVPTMNIFRAVKYKKLRYIKHNLLSFLVMCLIPVLTVLLILLSPNLRSLKGLEILPLNLNLPIDQMIVYMNFIPEDKNIDFIRNLKYSSDLDFITSESSDLKEELQTMAKQNPLEYTDRVIFGIDISLQNSKWDITCLFSTNLLHSLPVCMNLASNYILTYYTKSTDPEISITNMPIVEFTISKYDSIQSYTDYIAWAIMMYMVFYLVLPLTENFTEFKIMEKIPKVPFWLFTFIIDAAIHSLVCFLIAIISYFIGITGLECCGLYLIFLIYGLVNLPFTYIVSQCFKDFGNALTCISYVMLIPFIASVGISSSIENILKHSTLVNFLHIFPFFGLQHSLKIFYENKRLETSDNAKKLGYNEYFIWMPILFVIYFLILIYVVDNMSIKRSISKFCKRCSSKGINENALELGDDVKEEADTVNKSLEDKNLDDKNIIISNISKSYYSSNFNGGWNPFTEKKAIKNISFCVRKGECFGLLGLNGAGKSTTFKILTNSEFFDDGSFLINEKDVYGYCPQGDALIHCMTGYEMLKYIALLRGVPEHKTKEVVSESLSNIGISEYGNVEISGYSGGTKRKLNTAMAMINKPKILLLDEPTTGVDPVSRRIVWSAIKDYQNENRSIVITSHSMDECEILCHRLAIMQVGIFECLGPIPKLKLKHGKGFSLCVEKPKANQSVDVTDSMLSVANPELSHRKDITSSEIQNLYSGEVELVNKNEDYQHYFVYKEDIKWSVIFKDLIKLKEDKTIEDFAINETSLGDIFLSFRNKLKEVSTEA